MTRIRRFLFIAITVSLLTGYGSIQEKETVSAATVVTTKAASDFTLKLPGSWNGSYVMKSSKGKKHGSYVAFYAKKCYNQTKQGWLFSIARYKDNSYEEMPSYELVGKWNGFYYVAIYPTDVQSIGATKDAQKQYSKMNQMTEKTAKSIQPIKKVKKKEFFVSDFALKLPNSWKGKYIVKKSRKIKHNSYVAFYSKQCYQQTKEGWLISIARYKDDSYQEMPSYELVGKWNGFYYVALYPTDVQFMGASKSAQREYSKLNQSSEKMAHSIKPVLQ